MGRVLLVFVSMWIAVGLFISCVDSCGSSSEGASQQTYQALFEEKIKGTLINPPSASFTWSVSTVYDDGKTSNGICQVRSTNVFGAYVTNDFWVTGKLENGEISISWY